MKKIEAMIIWLLFMAIFVALFWLAFRLGTTSKMRKMLFTKKRVIVLVVGFLLLFLLCVFTLSKNDFVYYWDYGGYWTQSYTQASTLFSDPTKAIGDLWTSIIESDYNLILPTLISLPMQIFGYAFTRYILINYVCFMVPALLIMLVILAKVHLQTHKVITRWDFLKICLIVFTFMTPFLALLNGYIDCAALIPVSLVILIAIDYDPLVFDKSQIKKSVVLGLLLLIAFLFRRYFVFFIIGFAVAMVIKTLLLLYRKYGFKMKKMKESVLAALKNCGVIAATTLSVLLICFNGLVVRILSNDYAEQYVGYSASLGDEINDIVVRFGWLYIALMVFGIIYGFIKKRNRILLAFCLVMIVTSVVAIFRIQKMDLHHTYIIVVPALILIYLGFNALGAIRIKNKAFLQAVCALLLLVEPVAFVSDNVNNKLGVFNVIYPKHHDVMYRSDKAEIEELIQYTNELEEEIDSPKVYILASGCNFNGDIILSFYKPTNKETIKNVVLTADVDLRDGFPKQFLTADIIITTTPVETHLAEGTQTVVTYLREELIDSSSAIGKHFEKDTKTFQLDNGVEVEIYLKKSEFSEDDLREIAEYYKQLYPEYDELFSERILSD